MCRRKCLQDNNNSNNNNRHFGGEGVQAASLVAIAGGMLPCDICLTRGKLLQFFTSLSGSPQAQLRSQALRGLLWAALGCFGHCDVRSPCVCHAKSVVNCVALKSTHATCSNSAPFQPICMRKLYSKARGRQTGERRGSMLQNAQKISALYFDFDRCRQLVRVCVCEPLRVCLCCPIWY